MRKAKKRSDWHTHLILLHPVPSLHFQVQIIASHSHRIQRIACTFLALQILWIFSDISDDLLSETPHPPPLLGGHSPNQLNAPPLFAFSTHSHSHRHFSSFVFSQCEIKIPIWLPSRVYLAGFYELGEQIAANCSPQSFVKQIRQLGKLIWSVSNI